MSYSNPQLLSKVYHFLPHLEALLGVYNLLLGESRRASTDLFFSRSRVNEWQQSFRHLFETYGAVKELTGAFVLECLLDFDTVDFSLEEFEAYLLGLPEEERLWSLAPWSHLAEATKEDLKAALVDEKILDDLYGKVQNYCSSYLGFVAFIRESDRYLKEYLDLAKLILSDGLETRLAQNKQKAQVFQEKVNSRLEKLDPLSLSEELMGKQFRNRGPYEMTYFIPSLLLPSRCLRLFDEDETNGAKQFVFCRLENAEKNPENTVAVVKAFADETRYRILMLLSQSGPMKGQEIVKALKLAPSTISHHMTALSENGLVVEEPVKTAKYYSLSKKNLDQLLKTIVEDLDLKTFEE
ncbi:DNA-binding transcriptional ArsR family regulator [Streptococcus rupicaprae]|uniref:DNA-binding transcriptional ArsR family regulator n=1 Tax=Streptococcus rupicaprae TaxID=759619 RepID=A0ABV2FKN9_9STRE